MLIKLGVDRNNIPDVWRTDWDKAMESKGDHCYLSHRYLDEMNCILHLPDEQIQVLYDTGAYLKSSEPLKQLTWLWYYCLFEGMGKDDNLSSVDWPLPLEIPKRLTDAFYGIIFLAAIPSMRRFYKEKNIPENVFIQTLSDMRIGMSENLQISGNYGFGSFNLDWMQRHIKGRIFRLGRLQFMSKPFEHDLSIYRHNDSGEYRIIISSHGASEPQEPQWTLVLQKDDIVLEVHIPGGEPLSPEACQASYKNAHKFYNRIFPDLHYSGFTCESWLLSPILRELLPPESNTVKFQESFIKYLDFTTEDYFRHIFRLRSKEGQPLDDLPEDTSMRRIIKKYLLSGGSIFSAGGFIDTSPGS